MTPCPRCGHWISEAWVHHCMEVTRTFISNGTADVTYPRRRQQDTSVQTAKLDQLRERWKGDPNR